MAKNYDAIVVGGAAGQIDLARAHGLVPGRPQQVSIYLDFDGVSV